MNLLFLTIFSELIDIIGILIFLSINILISSVIVKKRIFSLYLLLFNVDKENSKHNNLLKKVFSQISKIVWVIIIICIAFLFIFQIKIDLLLSVVGFLILWGKGNLLFVFCEMYFIFPFFFQAYYKWKYPEEYREWEGKTLEEWYGKKYLKKHPELRERDH